MPCQNTKQLQQKGQLALELFNKLTPYAFVVVSWVSDVVRLKHPQSNNCWLYKTKLYFKYGYAYNCQQQLLLSQFYAPTFVFLAASYYFSLQFLFSLTLIVAKPYFSKRFDHNCRCYFRSFLIRFSPAVVVFILFHLFNSFLVLTILGHMNFEQYSKFLFV